MCLIFRLFLVVTFLQCVKTATTRRDDKRNLLQFSNMILCETGRSSLRYIDYGCYCGLGGKGRPLDDADRCCYHHDHCYGRLTKSGICSHFSTYNAIYNYKGCSDCLGSNSYSRWETISRIAKCKEMLCRCDANAARCLKYARYNPKLRNYNPNFCR